MGYNLLFISPHFPPNFKYYCRQLKNFGVTLLGVADEAYDNLHPELKEILTEYYKVGTLEDFRQVRDACNHFIHKFGPINRVESLNEHWLPLEARIREEFHIDGYKTEQMKNLQKKSYMKSVFKNAGVQVARGSIANTLEEAQNFVKQVGYPIVIKPDIGVGATFTYKIKNDEDLKKCFVTIDQLRAEAKSNTANSNNPFDYIPREERVHSDYPEDFFVEEFVEGQLVTFDGLVNSEGKIVFFTSEELSVGIMEIVNNDAHVYYFIHKSVPKELIEVGTKSVTAFSLRQVFFHFEFFKKDDGTYVALEGNFRPPGGYTVDMMNFAHSIDLYREWANIVINDKFDPAFNNCAPNYSCFASRKFRSNYRYRHDHDTILQKFNNRMMLVTELPELWKVAMGDFTYVFVADSEDQVREIAGYIQDREACN